MQREAGGVRIDVKRRWNKDKVMQRSEYRGREKEKDEEKGQNKDRQMWETG